MNELKAYFWMLRNCCNYIAKTQLGINLQLKSILLAKISIKSVVNKVVPEWKVAYYWHISGTVIFFYPKI